MLLVHNFGCVKNAKQTFWFRTYLERLIPVYILLVLYVLISSTLTLNDIRIVETEHNSPLFAYHRSECFIQYPSQIEVPIDICEERGQSHSLAFFSSISNSPCQNRAIVI